MDRASPEAQSSSGFPGSAHGRPTAASTLAFRQWQCLLEERLTRSLLDFFRQTTGLPLNCWGGGTAPESVRSRVLRLCARDGWRHAVRTGARCQACWKNRWRRHLAQDGRSETRFAGLCGAMNYCARLGVPGARQPLATFAVQQKPPASPAGEQSFARTVRLTRLIVHDLQSTLASWRLESQLASGQPQPQAVDEGGLPSSAGPFAGQGADCGAVGSGATHTLAAPPHHRLQVVQCMLDYIHEHYSEPIQLNDLAAATHLNASYACSLFSMTTGVTFHHYLENLRLTKAKDLLRDPVRRISEVAYAVGYANPNHFRNVFTDRVGLSPSAWRAAPEPNLRNPRRVRATPGSPLPSSSFS